ncbi:MAG: hypothetical protein MJK14_17815 [Rivularia sp. ALOHA_DT_140]|nr:hypothetical protein [Rivularia sp. ALOHA_DT_140]
MKVVDLSFCETDVDNYRKVKGGKSSLDSLLSHYRTKFADYSFPVAKSDWKLVEQSLAKDGYKTSYYYDDATGSYTLSASKKYGSGKTYSGLAKHYFYNGKSVSGYSSSVM